ncbi:MULTISPECIES: hypothetical protein [Novilysobacter]|uniref:hypothetical protein n=1 Tax=Novilysobacter TaxID=3382699 RepID=UPI002FC91798
MKLLNASLLLAWFALLSGAAHASQGPGPGMMSEGMMGGWMMAGCVLLGVLLIIFLVLAVVALIKYLRSDRHPRP